MKSNSNNKEDKLKSNTFKNKILILNGVMKTVKSMIFENNFPLLLTYFQKNKNKKKSFNAIL